MMGNTGESSAGPTTNTVKQDVPNNPGQVIGIVNGDVHFSNHPKSSGWQSFLQSFAFTGMNAREKDITKTPGTCDWIIKHPTFREWEEAPAGTVWIKGDPGTGKSTLLHHALECQRSASNHSIILYYFINARGNPLDHSIEGIWRCLLHQAISTGLPKLQKEMNEFQTRCDLRGKVGDKWKWHEKELRTMLFSALEEICDQRPIILFLDALDEMDEEGTTETVQYLQHLTDSLTSPQYRFTLKVCFSCRRFPLFNHRADYEIETDKGNEDDITKTISLEIDACFPSEWREPIYSTLVKKSQNSYQWVVLMLRRVCRLFITKGSLEQILKEISSVPPDLDLFYDRILEQLDLSTLKKSISLFRWVLCVEYPLSIQQLWAAMHVDPKKWSESAAPLTQLEFDKRLEDLADRVVDLSGGLLRKKAVRYPDDLNKLDIEPIHQSVVDYMQKTGFHNLARKVGASSPIRNEYFISRYLINFIIHIEESEDSGDFFARYRQSRPEIFGMAIYACRRWDTQLHMAEKRGESSRDVALLPSKSLEILSKYYLGIYRHDGPDMHWIFNLLIACACSGLSDLLLHLKDKMPSRSMPFKISKGRITRRQPLIDRPIMNGRTILQDATSRGHNKVVQVLIHDYLADPNISIENDWSVSYKMTALNCAIVATDLEMVLTLLNVGANPNFPDTLMPLNLAIAYGDRNIISVLEDKGARFSFNKDEFSLFHALWERCTNGMADLIRRGANTKVCWADSRWETEFLKIMAESDNVPEFVELLRLMPNIDLNQSVWGGISAFAYALWKGKLGTAKALLEAGANINDCGGSRIPDFKEAVLRGNTRAIELCAAYGAQWRLKLGNGDTYVFHFLKERLSSSRSYTSFKNALEVVEYMSSLGAINGVEYTTLMLMAEERRHHLESE